MPRYYIDNTVTVLDRPEAYATFAEYKVTATYQDGDPIVESDYSNTIRYDEVDGIAIDKISANNTSGITEYKLYQNYPNPFNPKTMIRYSVGGKGKSHTVIKVYDIIGREVVELLNEEKESGEYEIELDANKYKLTSGVYIYKMQSGGFSDIKKLLIVK